MINLSFTITPDNAAEILASVTALCLSMGAKIQAVEPVKKVEPVETIEPVKPVEYLEPVKPVEYLEPAKTVETVEPAQPTKKSRGRPKKSEEVTEKPAGFFEGMTSDQLIQEAGVLCRRMLTVDPEKLHRSFIGGVLQAMGATRYTELDQGQLVEFVGYLHEYATDNGL